MALTKIPSLLLPIFCWSILTTKSQYFDLNNSLQIPPQLLSNLTTFLSHLPSNNCSDHVILLVEGLLKKQQWALQMIDASAKIQTGFLDGNVMQVGNFDECLEIEGKIGGKYCVVHFGLHETYGQEPENFLHTLLRNQTFFESDAVKRAMLFSQGFCIPKICTEAEIQEIFNMLEQALKSPIHFEFDDEYCQTGDSQKLSAGAAIAIALLCLFGLLVVFSTFYDICTLNRDRSVDLLKSFSFYKNCKILLSASTNNVENLRFLDGLRVISMMWIILGHQLQWAAVLPSTNGSEKLVFSKKWESTIFVPGFVAVDTFFVISGLLTAYWFLKARDKGLQMSILKFYFHRIIRLTAPLAFLILFTSTLMRYISTGPFFYHLNDQQAQCEKNWWYTLLFIQNYFNSEHDLCIGPAWFLAVDLHMHFISPLVMIALIKWPKATIWALVAAIACNVVHVFQMSLRKRFGIMGFSMTPDAFDSIYAPTHARFPAYLIGMICGYVIYKKRNEKIMIPKFLAILLWILLMLVVLLLILCVTFLEKYGYSNVSAATFNSVHRIAWSTAISMFAIFCASGYGGPINTFLSSSVFCVLIKVNYSMYLLHYGILAFFSARTRSPGFFSTVLILKDAAGVFVVTVIISFVWTSTFERPLLAIEKYFSRGSVKGLDIVEKETADGSVELNVRL